MPPHFVGNLRSLVNKQYPLVSRGPCDDDTGVQQC